MISLFTDKKKKTSDKDEEQSILPFRVLVHMSVALYAIFLDKEFDSLIKGCSDTWRLFSQKNIDRIFTGQAHNVLGTSSVRATFAIGTVHHAI